MIKQRLVLLIALITLCLCTECPDGSVCEDTQTCCQIDSSYGCCPYENGVCCSDQIHCCPSQYTCDLELLQCKKEGRHFYRGPRQTMPLATIKKNQHSFDWDALLKCLQSTQPVIKEVIELINAIVAKDYNKALELLYKVIEDGSAVIAECLKIIQKRKNIDWDAILKCLKQLAPLVPEVIELIKAIEQGDFIRAMTLMYELIEKGITIVQECFGPLSDEEVNWDWDALLQCILKAEPLAKDILELIDAIQKGDYAKATTLVFQLIKDGSEVITQCLKV